MTELILLRHGKTAMNESGVYCGSSDPSLSSAGIAVTHRTARVLEPFTVDYVYASDKKRCVQSAGIVSPHRRVITTSALREMNFGDFEGLDTDEISRRMPQQWQNYLNDPFAFSFPGGDSVSCFLQRAAESVQQIAVQHEGQSVLVVTHKGVIMAALSHFLHSDLAHIFNYDVRPSGFARLNITDNHSVLVQLY